jgi:hypothetical protein
MTKLPNPLKPTHRGASDEFVHPNLKRHPVVHALHRRCAG